MQRNIEDLANAIIIQAVKDYRKFLNILSRNPNNKEAYKAMRRIERFFCSRWFSVLSDLNGKQLIKQIKEDMIMMLTNFPNSINANNFEIQEPANSLLVVAKKKIILLESKIITDKSKLTASYEYLAEFDSEYEKTASGILLAR